MAKFRKNLSKTEQEKLFIEFAQALGSLKSTVEMAEFIRDLLSEQETVMLARRLQIAKLLSAGQTYQKIREQIKVSYATIARVQTWLQLYGNGYRRVLERTQKNPPSQKNLGLKKIKKSYPMYFWPQLLIEEIIKKSSEREKNRLRNILSEVKEKTGINKQLYELLK